MTSHAREWLNDDGAVAANPRLLAAPWTAQQERVHARTGLGDTAAIGDVSPARPSPRRRAAAFDGRSDGAESVSLVNSSDEAVIDGKVRLGRKPLVLVCTTFTPCTLYTWS